LIYPTRTAVLAAAAGAPVALLVAVLMPSRWYAGLAWPAAVLLLTLLDAITGVRKGSARIDRLPSVSVGATVDAKVTVTLDGAGAPRAAEVAIAANPLLTVENDGRLWIALEAGRGAALLQLTAVRRGMAQVGQLWLRWRGPFGLTWKQQVIAIDLAFPILPDIRPVQQRGAQIFQRHALQGLRCGFRIARRIPFGHGSPRDRLEAVSPPLQAPRQGIQDRAQQPDRVRDRCRASDVGAGRRAAPRRSGGFGDAADGMGRAQAG
jgi:hypothetical protein